MTMLELALNDNRTQYLPNEVISGLASWNLGTARPVVELRLSWYTRGKGTQDTRVERKVPFDDPRARDTREFRLPLPDGPYSFSGRLISLVWQVELVAGTDKQTIEFTLSPTGQEILLAGIGPVK